MREVSQFLLLVVLLFCNSANAEVDLGTPQQSDNAMPSASVSQPKQWYMGGAISLGYTNWDDALTHDYYRSQGYYETGDVFGTVLSSAFSFMGAGKFYVGHRESKHLGTEAGLMYGSQDATSKFENNSGYSVTSTRTISVKVLYLSALLRAPYDDYGNGLYFKLAGHLSQLGVHKSVTGNAPNLGTLAAGDMRKEDGTATGIGWMAGIGFDFRIRTAGAIRLEFNSTRNIGGTAIGLSAVNIGYHGNF